MKKEFDLDKIGKKVPYKVPDAFFEEMQQNVWARVSEPERKKFSLFNFISVFSAVAAVFSAVIFLPLHHHSQPDMKMSQVTAVDNAWLENVSDEDLESMSDFTECDIFMH